RTRLLLALSLSAGALIVVGVPRTACAQGRGTFEPDIAVCAVHDDNLFSTFTPQTDVVWRVTPGATGGYETQHVTWTGKYHFDAERYRDHEALNRNMSRQAGTFDLKAHSAQGVTFLLSSDYNTTNIPSELNLTTGLVTTRSHATEVRGRPEL